MRAYLQRSSRNQPSAESHSHALAPNTSSLRTIIKEGIQTTSQPLDASVRQFMEPRFGWNFSKVRVHANAEAVSSAQALQARAYTVGDNIIFGRDEFRPGSESGRRLLAHELAHTIQRQQSPEEVTAISSPYDLTERQADSAASQAMKTANAPGDLSASLQQLGGNALRRTPVPAWGGEFDIGEKGYFETYVESPREGKVRPGVQFHLKFTPNQLVDARELAFVQSVTALLNDQPHSLHTIIESRSIPQGDVGEGLHIDVFHTQKSPFIADQSGQSPKAIEMLDTPGFKMNDSDSAEMDFTTSVTATKGKQAGAYYGGVKWGWTRQPKQKAKKIPLAEAREIVPGGGLFKTIAGLWDASKTSAGEKTEHLPTVGVKYTKAKTQMILDPAKPKGRGAIDLDINTKVEVLETADPTKKGYQNVIVTDGKSAGKMGWILDALSDSQVLVPKKRSKS